MMKLGPFSEKNKCIMGMDGIPETDDNHHIPIIIAAERERPAKNEDVARVNHILQTVMALQHVPVLITKDQVCDRGNHMAEILSEKLFIPHYIVETSKFANGIVGRNESNECQEIYEQENKCLIRQVQESWYGRAPSILIALVSSFGRSDSMLSLIRMAVKSNIKVITIGLDGNDTIWI